MTNIPTPYRLPLWQCLGERHDLNVAFLAESEPARSWAVDLSDANHAVTQLHARVIGRNSDTTFYFPSATLMALIRRRPDAVVIDGWESPAYLAARWAARRLGIPIIASYRSTVQTHRHKAGPVAATRRWFFSGVHAVVTAGQASTRAALDLSVPREKIAEGFNTVDVARFEQALRLRGKARGPGHAFLYVGQFIARKNLVTLLESFAQMRSPEDSLTLVGDGPERRQLARIARHLGLSGTVSFPGALDGEELLAAYAAADTLVLPSSEEVWGLVVNEALVAGLHTVVTSTCGVAAELEGQPGVFITEPDVTALADALAQSRDAWAGPIADHPVASHTPRELADVFDATILRVARHQRRIETQIDLG
ncbi:MAG: glycosyltransferase [Coriobacteriales bacterium]|nr:glycosyltransferase [Coriobacteriales bacterium]